jgi:hypothetical protein
MRIRPDNVEWSLMTALGVTAATWIVLEVRHGGRFGVDRGPMSPRIRTLLMWISFVEIAAYTFWSTQHGTFVY